MKNVCNQTQVTPRTRTTMRLMDCFCFDGSGFKEIMFMCNGLTKVIGHSRQVLWRKVLQWTLLCKGPSSVQYRCKGLPRSHFGVILSCLQSQPIPMALSVWMSAVVCRVVYCIDLGCVCGTRTAMRGRHFEWHHFQTGAGCGQIRRP